MENKSQSDGLGIALTKCLVGSEPGLLDCDLAATARAAHALANLLGCILATVLVKQPENFISSVMRLQETVVKSASSVAANTMTKTTNPTMQ